MVLILERNGIMNDEWILTEVDDLSEYAKQEDEEDETHIIWRKRFTTTKGLSKALKRYAGIEN